MERRKKPRPYLDTNIILDYIRRRGHEDKAVDLFNSIKRRKIECFTSNYTLLELIDHLQEDRWIDRCRARGLSLDDIKSHQHERNLKKHDLRDVWDQLEESFLKPFVYRGIVTMVTPTSTQWDEIYDYLARYNFTIYDVFHVDAALGYRCNVFITNDGTLTKLLKESGLLPAADLQNLEKKLAELGIRRIMPL